MFKNLFIPENNEKPQPKEEPQINQITNNEINQEKTTTTPIELLQNVFTMTSSEASETVSTSTETPPSTSGPTPLTEEEKAALRRILLIAIIISALLGLLLGALITALAVGIVYAIQRRT